jgi:spore coat protein A
MSKHRNGEGPGWKLTRRRFLQTSAIGGAGLAAPWVWTSRKALAQPLPTIIDPLYTAPVVDPAAVLQFSKPMPVIRDLGLRQDLTAGGTVGITMGPAFQDLLGMGLNTPVWGYDVGLGITTYPGGTIVAKRGNPVTVNWSNNLGFDYLLKQGNPADGDVIDRTLHWAFSPHLTPAAYTIGTQGVPAVAHQHGGRSDSVYDGLPEQWFTPLGATGQHYFSNTYVYDLDQEAATLWYHDHALGITRQNVYAGLAGFWLLRDDDEDALMASDSIPSGPFETEIVIQDRMFYPDGRLAYPDVPWISPNWVGGPSHQPEFFGQVILVNGQAWPFHNVEPRQYRFRLLNGSDSRFYELDIKPVNTALPSPSFWVIGNDTGLLDAPVPVNKLTIGPGERYDVVVDFSGTLDGAPDAWNGASLTVRNSARSPFPKGATVNPNLDGTIMQFRVGVADGGGIVAPLTATTNLRPVTGPIPALTATAPNRRLMLFEALDRFGRLQPLLGTITGANNPDGTPADGTFLWDDPITENPALNSTEVWEIHNATVDAHPIHLHLVKYQILNRQRFRATVVAKDNVDHTGNVTTGGALRNVTYQGKPKGPDTCEAGWKDTAIMYPGEVTRIIATFDKPGRYVWHCHILSHEDHEMMRPYEVV